MIKTQDFKALEEPVYRFVQLVNEIEEEENPNNEENGGGGASIEDFDEEDEI